MMTAGALLVVLGAAFLLDAGGLFSRASLYRNDRTPQRGLNPHGFLIDGLNFPDALRQGQLQEATFLLAGASQEAYA